MDTNKKVNDNKGGFVNSFLNMIEVVGNKLPHPATIFLILCIIVAFVSFLAAYFEVSVSYYDARKKQEITVMAVSLFDGNGIRYVFENMTKHFINFAPLGYVLIIMLGIGIAEEVGLISAVLKKVVLAAPKRMVTAVVVFMGISSSLAADAGYVVLIPLGAIVFLSFNRHPVAGLMAAFAGVSAGFSANLLIGSIDPLLAGITNEAIKLAGGGNYNQILPTANYYFMAASVFVLTIVGTFVTEKIVEPRLGKYSGEHKESMVLDESERKGLRVAGWVCLLYVVVIAFLVVPENGILRTPIVKDGVVVGGDISKFLHNGLITALMVFFFLPSVAFGFASKRIKNDKDVVEKMNKSMSSMGAFLVISFTASQFIALFNYTNLGTILAVEGAEFLKNIGLNGLPLVLLFILVSAFINLFVGSASAKWAIMAPVFVPMLMMVGISPEFTQLAYRIGDSSTNVITPLMTYFALIIVFVQKYDKKAGIGTIISGMLPYSVAFLIIWSILLVLWYFAGLPIGPNATMFL